MEQRRIQRTIATLGVGLVITFHPTPTFSQDALDASGYRFVCEDDGAGRSAIDVLRATGDHDTFLELFARHDPEGFAILADPQLADKTVWAPTDAAFEAVRENLSQRPTEDVKAILGFHVSPPRRSPAGAYPIVTPEFLLGAGTMTHQTRTGVLTASDQRTRTSVSDGVLRLEEARILDTAWCTEAGSILSLDAVVMEVAHPSLLLRTKYRTIRILFYDDVRFIIYATLIAVALGGVVAWTVDRRQRQARRVPKNPER